MTGISDYIEDELITLEVIEVIPTKGVYYDNSPGQRNNYERFQ